MARRYADEYPPCRSKSDAIWFTSPQTSDSYAEPPAYQFKGLAIDDILKYFKTERSKNIVLAEILQLIFSDGVFHDQERESVRLIKMHFGFDSSEFSDFKDWIGKIKDIAISK